MTLYVEAADVSPDTTPEETLRLVSWRLPRLWEDILPQVAKVAAAVDAAPDVWLYFDGLRVAAVVPAKDGPPLAAEIADWIEHHLAGGIQ